MSRSRRGVAAALLVTAAIALSACGSTEPTPSPVPACPTAAPTLAEATSILAGAGFARVHTNKGDFSIELYGDAAPIAAANFVLLARCDFYRGVTFHRVVPGFVIQAGDPQTKFDRAFFDGLGTGGPGYRFAIEPPDPSLGYDPYVVAMGNRGVPDSNGSQFFIDLVDLNERLARSYTIFGLVIDGTGAIDAIGALPTDANDVPLDPAVITAIEVMATASASPSPGS